MDLLFENKTRFSEKAYEKFLEFHSKKFRLRFNLYNIFVILLLIIGFIINLKYGNYITMSFIIVIALIFILWRFVVPIYKISKEMKSNKMMKAKQITCKFYNKLFTVSDKSDSYELHYYNLYRVFETDKFFYLYISHEYAFLLDKKYFTVGTSEDFANFIKSKCTFKYKKIL